MTRAIGRFFKGAVSLLVFKTLSDRQVVTVGRKITGVGRELQRYGIIRGNLLQRLWGVCVLYTNN